MDLNNRARLALDQIGKTISKHQADLIREKNGMKLTCQAIQASLPFQDWR